MIAAQGKRRYARRLPWAAVIPEVAKQLRRIFEFHRVIRLEIPDMRFAHSGMTFGFWRLNH